MKPIDRHPSRSIRTFQRERSPGAWERNKNPSTNENATNENAVILDSKKQIFVSSSPHFGKYYQRIILKD